VQVLVTVAPNGVGPDGVADRSRGDYTLPEWDAHALEAALVLQASQDGVEVVTATVGPSTADPVVRAGLARGADRAIRLWDDRLAEADLFDPRLKARLLAPVVADVAPTLVLTGAQSGPEGFGATGVTLASALGYGWATVVTDVALDRDAEVVSVRCDRDGGRYELVDISLPAVLTVGTGCNEPRHAALGAVRAAQQADVAVRSLEDIGLDAADTAGSLARVDTVDRDPDATLFEGAPAAAAADLARVLRAHGVKP